MFRRLPEAAVGAVTIAVDGASVAARAGDTVAAALLASGIWAFRTSGVSGTARGPYCMMGVCFDCLAEIDGVPNRQSCMIRARPGMRIRRQRGARALAIE
jgi:predicted molibdopterin-dependent oxidoreductase YjgC